MYKKMCYRCHRSSYSSSNQGGWICPYCSEDLTEQRAFHATVQQGSYQPLYYKQQAIAAYERKNGLRSLSKNFRKFD